MVFGRVAKLGQVGYKYVLGKGVAGKAALGVGAAGTLKL